MSSMSINPFSKLDNFSLSVQRTYSIIAATSAKLLSYNYRDSARVACFRMRGLGAVLKAGRPHARSHGGHATGKGMLLFPLLKLKLRPDGKAAFGFRSKGGQGIKKDFANIAWRSTPSIRL